MAQSEPAKDRAKGRLRQFTPRKPLGFLGGCYELAHQIALGAWHGPAPRIGAQLAHNWRTFCGDQPMAHVTYPEITAGHRFPPTVDDCQCECGRWWSDLDGLTDEAIGKPDLAHVGALNAAELEQIRERSRWMAAHRDVVWEALQGVAGGQR